MILLVNLHDCVILNKNLMFYIFFSTFVFQNRIINIYKRNEKGFIGIPINVDTHDYVVLVIKCYHVCQSTLHVCAGSLTPIVGN